MIRLLLLRETVIPSSCSDQGNLVVFKEFVNADLVDILQNRIVGGIVSQQGLKLIAMKLLGRSSGIYYSNFHS